MPLNKLYLLISSMNQKGFIKIIIVMLFVTLASVWFFSALNRELKKVPTPKLCLQDARKCPDGSFVGRSGKNCTFAKCPETPPNGEKIIKKVGEQEGSYLIEKINTDSVNGFWYQAYPVARSEGSPKTLHIGDDIGYVCEGVSEKLTDIDFSGQTVTFTKIAGKRPIGGCPI